MKKYTEIFNPTKERLLYIIDQTKRVYGIDYFKHAHEQEYNFSKILMYRPDLTKDMIIKNLQSYPHSLDDVLYLVKRNKKLPWE